MDNNTFYYDTYEKRPPEIRAIVYTKDCGLEMGFKKMSSDNGEFISTPFYIVFDTSAHPKMFFLNEGGLFNNSRQCIPL